MRDPRNRRRPKPTPPCYNPCMTEGASYCFECKQPLVQIDNRGTLLTACMTCNIWQDQDGNMVKLSVEDLAALHALRMK